MPYIEKIRRMEIDEEASAPRDAGELNYAITRMVLDYLETRGTRYSTINEIVGVLECAKQEFYRRLAATYENLKSFNNGDVYP